MQEYLAHYQEGAIQDAHNKLSHSGALLIHTSLVQTHIQTHDVMLQDAPPHTLGECIDVRL